MKQIEDAQGRPQCIHTVPNVYQIPIRSFKIKSIVDSSVSRRIAIQASFSSATYYDKTRGADKIHLSKPNTEIYCKSFEYYGALQYNQLTKEIRDLPTTGMFKQALLANNNSYYTM